MSYLFFELLQIALGRKKAFSQGLSLREWLGLYKKSEEQAVSGVMLSGLDKFSSTQRPPQGLLLQWIGVGQIIVQRNAVMDNAVVSLCKQLNAQNIRFLVVKGQTIAALYPQKGSRQCGDIDFIVHPSDWFRAYRLFADELGEESIDTHSEKHVEWEKDGISYEMHRWLNDFASKIHQRYWDEAVMKEAWEQPYSVEINGYHVPTLVPIHNVLFVFVHLFYHLINEGVGLRQFVDWYILIDSLEFNVDTLEKHLKEIGLNDAFCGCGAVLTDYLGLPKEKFPFTISKKHHERAHNIVENILKVGNFGHNRQYSHPHGVLHGLQQMRNLIEQCWKFGYLAPSESWGYILVKIRWWGKKLSKNLK